MNIQRQRCPGLPRVSSVVARLAFALVLAGTSTGCAGLQRSAPLFDATADAIPVVQDLVATGTAPCESDTVAAPRDRPLPWHPAPNAP